MRGTTRRVDALEVEQLERRQRDRGVPGLRVGHVPVAGGDLGEEREDGVPEVAVPRHQLPGAPAEEPVRLRVLDLAPDDRPDDLPELGRVHLVVAGHHGGHVDPLRDRPAIAADDGGPDAAVAVVLDHLDPRVAGRAGARRGRVARSVVDHEDAVDERRDPRQRRPDQLLLVVRGHDDGDCLPVDQSANLTRSRTQTARKPSRQVMFLPSSNVRP
jgi:hypothetical protein